MLSAPMEIGPSTKMWPISRVRSPIRHVSADDTKWTDIGSLRDGCRGIHDCSRMNRHYGAVGLSMSVQTNSASATRTPSTVASHCILATLGFSLRNFTSIRS